jgi:hypothetical protein
MDIETRLKELRKPSPNGGLEFCVGECRDSFRLTIDRYYRRPVITIHTLHSITRGGGRKALQAIFEVADEYGYRIRLKAVPYATPLRETPMPKDELVAYYKRAGFKFGTDEWLIRTPVDKGA